MALTPQARIAGPLAALGVAVAVVVAALLLATPGTAAAQEATASAGCSGGVTLKPATRRARRGGWIRLNGQTCGAGSASAGGRVRIKLRKSRRWATVAKAASDSDGSFSVCAPLSVSPKARVASLRASGPTGSSSKVRVRVSNRGSRGCGKTSKPKPSGGSGGSGGAPGELVASDTASVASPMDFWGAIDCETASRAARPTTGGDPAPMATGASQGNSSYRRLTVYDGDDFWGERCELGANDHRGPVAFYREGMHRTTYVSVRLPNNHPLDTDMWQGVLQMKQAQSSDNGGGTPVLSLSTFNGEWSLWHSDPGPTSTDHFLWSTPAEKNVWTRIAIEAYYSQHKSKGWVRMSLDLNADGDFEDSGEQSPTFHTNTLKYETAGDSSDGLTAGQSIPSHLRVGMYHHPNISCPSGTGCSVDVDNVQVVS